MNPKVQLLKRMINEEIKRQIALKEELNWAAVDNAVVKFLKSHVSKLERAVKERNVEVAIILINSILDGLSNAQNTLNLNEANTSLKENNIGDPQLNKEVRTLIKRKGFTPEKLGSDYQLKMAQVAYAALVDANFHTEAKTLAAQLNNSPEYENGDIADADSIAYDLGTDIAAKAEWSGALIASAIIFTLQMDGSHKLANAIKSLNIV